MSGVWVFKKGVVRLVENPGAHNSSCDRNSQSSGNVRRKVLVYTPSNDVITSYAVLHQKLSALGWERYCGDHPHLLQYHKTSTLDLISLPVDFGNFKSMHMYDIVVKNRNLFQVKDA